MCKSIWGSTFRLFNNMSDLILPPSVMKLEWQLQEKFPQGLIFLCLFLCRTSLISMLYRHLGTQHVLLMLKSLLCDRNSSKKPNILWVIWYLTPNQYVYENINGCTTPCRKEMPTCWLLQRQHDPFTSSKKWLIKLIFDFMESTFCLFCTFSTFLYATTTTQVSTLEWLNTIFYTLADSNPPFTQEPICECADLSDHI